MTFSNQAQFDVLRSATTASIGAAYATIGAPLATPALILGFKNATNGDVLVSTDGTSDYLFFPANSAGVFDIRTNAAYGLEYLFKTGTQFYVKDGTTVGTTGAFYIEAVTLKEHL